MALHPLIRIQRLALLVLLALALVATAYAHRVPAPQDASVAFALANGVPLADFCGEGPDGDGPRAVHCPACQISGAADLPPAALTQTDLELAFHAPVTFPRESRALRHLPDPARSLRGPPVA